MQKYWVAYCVGIVFSMQAAPCLLGPNGINQWQLIYQVGECVNTSTEILCSKIENLSSAVDCSELSLLEPLISQLEPLVSMLELCDICSGFDIITTDIDLLSSQIDFLSSKSDVCCSLLDNSINSISDVLSSQEDACCSELESVIISSTDLLKSNIDFVFSTVDGIMSCCEKLDSCVLGTVITSVPYVITEPGTYTLCQDLINFSLISPAISIQSDGVTFDLNGYTLFSTEQVIIEATNVKDIIIKNGSLDNSQNIALSSPLTESLVISGCTQVQVSDINVIRSRFGVGFNIQNTKDGIFERCNFIKNSTVLDSGSTGSVFVIQGTSDAIIVRSCQIFDALVNAFEVTTSAVGFNGILFEDCFVGRAQLFSTAIGYYVHVTDNVLVSFKRCIANFLNYGFYVTTSDRVRFEDCQATTCFNAGFSLESVTDMLVDSCDVFSSSSGFKVDVCNNSSISSSAAHGPSVGWGFQVNSCTDMIIENCDAQEFMLNGFELNTSSAITLVGCNAQASGLGGVGPSGGYYISSATDSALLVECTAQANKNGFNILGNNAVLERCTAAQNGIGVYIDPASNNATVENSLASGNTSSGLFNVGTGTVLITFRSSSVTPPTYQLNGLPDNFGSATIIP